MMGIRSRVALLAVIAIVAVACGGDGDPGGPEETPTDSLPGSDMLVCEVTDPAGVEDRSFNQLAHDGMERAQAELGVDLDLLESETQADFAPNIQAFIDRGCDLIVAVGSQLGDATEAAAEANPQQKFAIVDFAYDPSIDNVLGLVFSIDQASFLAGYASASWTQTGVLGTFGGANIGPPVTDFMDGFYAGAMYHNEERRTEVVVLGWDPATEEGLFTGDFENQDNVRRVTEGLIRRGADVILPVAGPPGLGTGAALQDSSEDDVVVGVNTDWCVTIPDSCSVILTSVTKNVDVAVFDAIAQLVDGTFAGGLYVGTLENDGVGLAGFHLYESQFSEGTLAELEEIRAAIIDGSISTKGVDHVDEG